MALRIVLVALVACLGIDMDSDPHRAPEVKADGAKAPTIPSTAAWIKHRFEAAERALSFRKSGQSRPEPTVTALGVGGTSLGWPNVLVAAVLPPAESSKPASAEALVAKVECGVVHPAAESVIDVEVPLEIGSKERDIADALMKQVVEAMAREFDAPVVLDEVDNPPVAVAQVQPEIPVAEPVASAVEPVTEAPVVVEADVEISAEPKSDEQGAPLSGFSRALRLTGMACEAWADIIEGRPTATLTRQDSENSAVR